MRWLTLACCMLLHMQGLLILLGMGLPATRDYYNFIGAESLSFSKIGSFAWLGLG